MAPNVSGLRSSRQPEPNLHSDLGAAVTAGAAADAQQRVQDSVRFVMQVEAVQSFNTSVNLCVSAQIGSDKITLQTFDQLDPLEILKKHP